jgi:hypothetical protein
MSSVRLGWLIPGLMLLALGGCEVSVGNCDDDAGDCDVDFDFDEGDASLDGSTTETDGAAEDGGVTGDGGEEDASTDEDAGPTGEPLTSAEFCAALYANALTFRDLFDECLCSNDDIVARDDLLLWVYGLQSSTLVGCEGLVESANVTFNDTEAGACAAAHNAQYSGTPSQCPAVGTGFDLDGLESQVGHGALAPVQIPACREAVVGKVDRDDSCSNSFECTPGLRCRPAPGGGKTCQPAVPNGGQCTASDECVDAHICVGGAARKCIPADDLLLNGGNCTASKECISGLLCLLDPLDEKEERFVCQTAGSEAENNICM